MIWACIFSLQDTVLYIIQINTNKATLSPKTTKASVHEAEWLCAHDTQRRLLRRRQRPLPLRYVRD